MIRTSVMAGVIGLGALGGALSGCAQPNVGEGTIFTDRLSFAGAASLASTDAETFSDNRLGALISCSVLDGVDAATVRTCAAEVAATAEDKAQAASSAGKSNRYDAAVNSFYQRYYEATAIKGGATASTFGPGGIGINDKDKRFYVARNVIQDQLLAASVQRCGAYVRYLKQLDASESFAFGALGTILSGAGAIVTGADAARSLAGAGAITTGVGAQARQSLFSNLTSSVIVPGIEKRRREVLQDIMKKRCHSVTTYTVSLAIADAVAFNNACSMDVGIEEGGKSLQLVQNPGLNSLKNSLRTFADIQTGMIQIAARAKSSTGAGDPIGTDSSGSVVSGQDAAAGSLTFEGYRLPVDCSTEAVRQFVGVAKQVCLVPAPTKPTGAKPVGTQGDEQALSVEDALYIQYRLGVPTDANFGTQTRDAIKKMFPGNANNQLTKENIGAMLGGCSNLPSDKAS